MLLSAVCQGVSPALLQRYGTQRRRRGTAAERGRGTSAGEPGHVHDLRCSGSSTRMAARQGNVQAHVHGVQYYALYIGTPACEV